jgi:hypothetical protein
MLAIRPFDVIAFAKRRPESSRSTGGDTAIRHERQHAPADHDGYRQQAVACAAARPRDFKDDVPGAAKILLRNVYGWFVRVERGPYAFCDPGRATLALLQAHLPTATAEELTVAAAS